MLIGYARVSTQDQNLGVCAAEPFGPAADDRNGRCGLANLMTRLSAVCYRKINIDT